MGWNWCRYGIWRKKTYRRDQLYILFPCLPAALSRMVSHPAQPENIDQILKIISRSRSHLSHFVIDRRSQPQISHQVEHLWGKKEKSPLDKILQAWGQQNICPSPVSFWPQCPPRARLSPPSRDPGWSSRQAAKQKTRCERRILMLKRKREDEQKNGLYR